MDELIGKSQQLKREADSILADSNILEILSSYGTPHITGGYALDVLARPDLDIYVTATEDNLSKAISVMQSLLETDYFDSTWFVNKTGVALTASIKGFYLQPHKRIGDNEWKLDVWLITEDQYEDRTGNFLKKLESLENPQHARNMILALKDHFRSGKKYVGKIDGQRIYKAVLDNPEASLDELILLVEELA